MLVTNTSQESFSIGPSKVLTPGQSLEVSELAYIGDYGTRADVNSLNDRALISISGEPSYFPLEPPMPPLTRAITIAAHKWVEFYEDGTANTIDITDPTSPVVTAGVGLDDLVAPFLLGDSPDPVIRKVSTAARPATSAAGGDYLACVDPGAWGNAADRTSHMDFQWRVGDAADPSDVSFVDVDPGTDFADGTFVHATQTGRYYVCVVSMTNAAGTSSANSNVIGPLS